MGWVDRLQEATRWREPGWECDWAETESALGTALPGDFKELCGRFGPGMFSSFHFKSDASSWNVRVMSDQGYYRLLPYWQKTVEYCEQDPDFEELFAPYGYYGVDGQRGLLKWGSTDTDWNFFWLADAVADPGGWPVVAKLELVPGEEWDRYEMTVSKFVYRLVTDPKFGPFDLPYRRKRPVFKRLVSFDSQA